MNEDIEKEWSYKRITTGKKGDLIKRWARDNMQGVQADLKLFDYKDNLVHQKTAVNLFIARVSNQVSSDLISNKFIYNPNAEKYLPVQLTQAEIEYQEQQVESAKDVAMKELKRHTHI